MTRLHDPLFIDFDGTPVTGRVPPIMRIVGERQLTPQQLGGVSHAYKLFRDAVRTMVGDYMVRHRVLPDGTRVRMESMQDHDVVYVWPAGGEGGGKLPHGFAVATSWRAPMIYRRDLNDGVRWLRGPRAPQIADHMAVHYDNQAFRKNVEANEFFNLPHVRNHTSSALWDYRRHSAPAVSATPVVPFLLKNDVTGAFRIGPPHYAAGGKLFDATGAALYTVSDEAPILVPEHPDYPEPVHQMAAITDAAGNQIALQAMRFTVISPTYNIWKFRFWNERLNRTADSTYTLVERAATEFTTPWGKQTTTTTSINDNSLGEDPALLFKFKATRSMLPDGYFGSGSGRQYVIGWAGPDLWVDITGVSVAGQDNQSLRQIQEQTTGVATYDKLVATAGATETGYIPIERRLNYPAKIFWRGGHHSKWYYPENLVAYFGWAPGTTLPLNYRIHSSAIERFDTQYEVDGTPTVTAKLGWTDLHLLEGTTTGRMSGKEHTNILGQIGLYYYIDSSWGYTWITKEIRTIDEFWPQQGFWDWMDGANVKDEYWEDYLAYGTQGYLGGPAPQPDIKYEYPFNNRPANTVSYALKSRYVIDFDQKGRFYAAIRCEVTAAGAAWRENIAVYKGFMEKDTDPSYTVKIWFECGWGGEPFGTPATGPTELLLVEETITRPMFEAITVSKFSPWYWPFPGYIDRDCKVRTPPEPVPDENFMMMFANLASHQGVNTNLCCADVRPDITGTDIEKSYSKDGVEYSYEDNGIVTPHTKYVTGQLYARTFKLSDFYEAFWMLYQLKVNAAEGDLQDEAHPKWFYHPGIKAALDVTRHIEVRDGVIVQWSDNIPTPISGYPPEPEAHPAPVDRIIKLYRV